jgi:glutathione S-transferase
MDITDLAGDRLILWGANWSLYSAKVRPYLIKKGIDFVELNPSHPHFHQQVVPRIGHITVPVLEAPDGHIVADSTEIMEHLEQQCPQQPMIPQHPVMAALAWLLHNYGSEGLLRPAMHYRWNTLESNRPFIVDEFSRALQLRAEIDEAEQAMGQTYAEHIWDYLPMLGVCEDNTPVTEQTTRRLYELLNAHFLRYPYLLGGSPSIADCGLMAPLYAHLGRDPSSSSELKLQAPALYRWIETMGRAQETDPELWYIAPGFFAPDDLPPTLLALLEFVVANYGPELQATADAFHHWLPGKRSGTIVAHDQKKANHQVLAEIEHEQAYGRVRHAAFLDPLPLHQRVTAIVEQMSEEQRANYIAMLKSVGGEAILELEIAHPIVRDNYAYVLA